MKNATQYGGGSGAAAAYETPTAASTALVKVDESVTLTPVVIRDSFTSSAIRVNINLNEAATPEQTMRAVERVCQALSQQESSIEHLRYLLGKLMANVQDRRLYEPEFPSFELFTQALAEKHRLSRSTMRDSLMIARNLPDLEPSQAAAIPITNLTLAARAARVAPLRQMPKLLQAAAEKSLVDFREMVESRGYVGKRGPIPQEEGYVTIKIKANAALAKKWEDLVGGQEAATLLNQLIKAYKAGGNYAMAKAMTRAAGAGAGAGS